VKRENEEKGE